jgi:putative membrane protein insertion efficiency factor
MCGNPWGRKRRSVGRPGAEREGARTIAPAFSPSPAGSLLLAHFLRHIRRLARSRRSERGRRFRTAILFRGRPSGSAFRTSRPSCRSERISRTTVAAPGAMASASACGRARAARSSRAAGRRAGLGYRRSRCDGSEPRPSHLVDRPGIPRRPSDSVRRAWLGDGCVRGRPPRRRRGRSQPGPADPAGRLAGGCAEGRGRARRRACRPSEDPRDSNTRTGDRGGRTARARAGDRSVTRVRRPLSSVSRVRSFLWAAGAPARLVLIGLVKAYRATLSGWLGTQCRFYPTCSRYAEEAIRTHGALRGVLMAAWRMARCGPFTDGGVDQVPPRRETAPVFGAAREGAGT